MSDEQNHKTESAQEMEDSVAQPATPLYSFNKTNGYLFRRIGAAVVYLWDEFPAELQNLIIKQAVLVGDSDFVLDGSFDDRAKQIETFIKLKVPKTTVRQ